MSAIAAAAGVSRPTLYHWFPTQGRRCSRRSPPTRRSSSTPGSRRWSPPSGAATRKPRRRPPPAGHLPRRPDGPGPRRCRPGLRDPVPGPLARSADGLVRPASSATPSTSVPAVRQRRLTREQAAELFLRVAILALPDPAPRTRGAAGQPAQLRRPPAALDHQGRRLSAGTSQHESEGERCRQPTR